MKKLFEKETKISKSTREYGLIKIESKKLKPHIGKNIKVTARLSTNSLHKNVTGQKINEEQESESRGSCSSSCLNKKIKKCVEKGGQRNVLL